MPLILTSRVPWRRRPSGLVEIDRSSPLVAGLVLCAPLAGHTIDLTRSGTIGLRTITATTPRVMQDLGVCVDLPDGGGYYADGLISAYPYTTSVWVWRDASGNDDAPVGLFPKSADLSIPSVAHYIQASGGSWTLTSATTGDFNTVTGPAAAAGVWTHVAGVWASATDRKLYVNGVHVATGTASRAIGTASRVTAGYYEANTSGVFGSVDGAIADWRVWSRALSAAEVWQLYAPDTRWSLYAPLVVRRYFDLGGGGTTYNESLSFAAASSVSISAAATSTAAIGVAATAALSPTGAASASAAVSIAAAAAAVMGGAATASAGLGVTAVTALAQSAAATGSVASSFAASAAVGQSGAATVPVGVSVSASTAAAMGAAATAAAGVDFSSAAQQTHAVTCLSSVAVAMSALAALSMSDGSAQNVSESVSFTATAGQQMAATAVAEAVQTYLVSAGLTHASAATAGAALALSVSAAIGQQATMQASATVILSAAAHLLLSSSASGDISYTVLRIAAETLRHARATSDTLHHAQTTGDTLQ